MNFPGMLQCKREVLKTYTGMDKEGESNVPDRGPRALTDSIHLLVPWSSLGDLDSMLTTVFNEFLGIENSASISMDSCDPPDMEFWIGLKPDRIMKKTFKDVIGLSFTQSKENCEAGDSICDLEVVREVGGPCYTSFAWVSLEVHHEARSRFHCWVLVKRIFASVGLAGESDVAAYWRKT